MSPRERAAQAACLLSGIFEAAGLRDCQLSDDRHDRAWRIWAATRKEPEADVAPALVTRSVQKASIAVTQVQCNMPHHGPTAPIMPEDGYLACIELSDCHSRELWLDGKAVQTHPLAVGDVVFHDLRRNPILNFRSPFHSLNFYLPRATLNSVADDANAPRMVELEYRPGTGVQDATMFELGRLLLPAFRNPEQASQLFIDHLMLAIAAHVLQAYGGIRLVRGERRRGGLAPWQERRAKDLLNAHLRWGSVRRLSGARMRAFEWAFRPRLSADHRVVAASMADKAPCGGGNGTAERSQPFVDRHCPRLRICGSEPLHARLHALEGYVSGGVATPPWIGGHRG